MAREQEEFQVYNTLSKQKEVFKPKVPGKVGIYVCGVTAYDFSHIGHARAYVAFDILYRYLKHLGYEVAYVRNFTDVDDKIIKRANERGVDPISLSAEFCQEFLDDMADLQCLPPTQQPHVSDHMEQIKDMIAQIESNDCAYRVDGDVYFSVDGFPNYGRLSGRKLEDNRAGERIAVDSRKRNPADFALWKAAKDGEPSWDSPWGPGRPGWHIECSAMSAHYLTSSFDIHGGGMDLIFPHHENEIAQSCAACPESNVSYWMHNGFVTANDEKMSKSLKNFFTIREVTKLYHPLALRHFLLGTHYRSPVNYSISQIEIASEAVYRIYQTLQDCEDALSLFREGSASEVTEPKAKTVRITDAAQECIRNLRNDVTKMSDDLHTFSILNSGLPEALKLMNNSLSLLKKKQQRQKQLSVIQSLTELEKEVGEALDILGLLSGLGYSEVLGQLKSKALKRSGFGDDYIEDQIKERALARKNKDFSKGDKIRSDLAAKGIALMDVGNETVWRPCMPVQQEQPCVPKQAEPCLVAEKEQQAPSVPVEQQQPGMPDATMGSTAITISNNYFSHHDKVMLLGHDDGYMLDKGMQVTIAFNHFGVGLIQRMPRCRLGYFHVVNNDFTEWKMYAIGGSANPTINSQGNRYTAPSDPSSKEVTKRVDTNEGDWEGWDWRSDEDEMVNGAYFVPSGQGLGSQYAKDSGAQPKSAAMIDQLTFTAGVLGGPRDNGGTTPGGADSGGTYTGGAKSDGMIFGSSAPPPATTSSIFLSFLIVVVLCITTNHGALLSLPLLFL